MSGCTSAPVRQAWQEKLTSSEKMDYRQPQNPASGEQQSNFETIVEDQFLDRTDGRRGVAVPRYTLLGLQGYERRLTSEKDSTFD